MSTDRLLSHEQGEEIIEQLNRISEPKVQRVPIPVPKTRAFEYDGEPHSFEFYNLDPTRVVVTGDVGAIAIGKYVAKCSLLNSDDLWNDGSRADIEYTWQIDSLANITSFSNAIDSRIVELINMADAGEIDLYEDLGWRVGDTRYIDTSYCPSITSGQTEIPASRRVLVLADRGVNQTYRTQQTYKDKSGNDRNYPSFVVTFTGNWPAQLMRTTATNSGTWSSTVPKTWLNHSTFFNTFPKDLKPIFKYFYVKTATEYNADTVSEVNTRFALFSEKEIFGESCTYSNLTERSNLTQIEWFKTTTNLPYNAWTRSQCKNNNSQYCCTNGSPAAPYADNANNTKYIRFFGVI